MSVLRCAVEDANFEVSTSVTPIKATISFGVSGREVIGQTTSDLIHNADVALYHSKIKGRNIFSIHSSDAYSIPNEGGIGFPIEIDQGALESRIEMAGNRFRPNPMREVKPVKEDKPTGAEEKDIPSRNKPKPAWMIQAYIGSVFLLALGLFFLVYPFWNYSVDWLALAAFGLVLVITESQSIEIYIKKTSISTSGVILLAGVFLLGPVAALFLSLTLAIVAKLVNHSEPRRMVFNASNHLLYSSAIAGIVLLSGGPITSTPVLINIGLCILLALLAYLCNTSLVAGAISISKDMPVRLVPIIRYHHERYDGKGYPEGLKGQEIPLEARIVALSDAFEAMASDRPYRKGLKPEDIKAEINRNSGTQFDPMVVETFNKLIQAKGDAFIQNSKYGGIQIKFPAEFVKDKEWVYLSQNQ